MNPGIQILQLQSQIFNQIFRLHRAVASGSLSEVKSILASGYPIDLKDQKGYTALNVASFLGNVPMSYFLIEQGASVSTKSNNGFTLLHSAAFSGNIDVTRILIQADLDVNEREDRGWTPLHIASMLGDVKMIEFFLKQGSQVNPMSRGPFGKTPLDLAVILGHEMTVNVLRTYGGQEVFTRQGKESEEKIMLL